MVPHNPLLYLHLHSQPIKHFERKPDVRLTPSSRNAVADNRSPSSGQYLKPVPSHLFHVAGPAFQ